MGTDDGFAFDFRTLNRHASKEGYEPFHWQRRLFKQLCQNDVRSILDLPTGVGKTSIIHIWLLALRQQILEGTRRLPIRLVYVVNRRTVVDQATELAWRAQQNLDSLGLPPDWLSVSTLRGRLADNREWTIDPSHPAVIIGTVDMIGSRLLFSGYRSSYKSRPLDAGLLGQDTLLILDEAHLSEPFEKLIYTLSDVGEFQHGQGTPMRIVRMSATTVGNAPDRFKLEPSDLEGTSEVNPIVQRYHAKKRLILHPAADKKSATKKIIEAAIKLAADNSRVVVFLRRPDDAQGIADAIRRLLKLFPNSVEVLTGTIRGLERDELLEKPILKRFLAGEEGITEQADKGPAVLVSTSAGEVGFDLNADHMVCDAAPLDSMIQRLGRVNRRGFRDAVVEVFPEAEKSTKKDAEETSKRTIESAAAEAMKCLEKLERNPVDGTYDASPKALVALRTQLTPVEFDLASTPKPATVAITDVLLDTWSMTTIVKRMPGRPPVAAWIRGLEPDGAETTIAWRVELDLAGFGELDIEEIEEWFDAHRVLVHETVTVPAQKAKDWIIERWNYFSDEWRDTVGQAACIIDRAGLQVMTVEKFVVELQQKRNSAVIDDAQIVLPASFGGIERTEGLLVKSKPEGDTNDFRKAPDVADVYGRFRLLRTRDDLGEHEEGLTSLPPAERSALARFTLDLRSAGDICIQLISLVPKRQRPEFGTREQRLVDHVELVEANARSICNRLGLLETSPIRSAVELAAAWHDRGKDREVWQCAAGREPGKAALGKSGGRMQRIRGGYRHEFGSLREFIDEHEGKIPPEIFDLAAHLIAAHHGRGRPHFPKGGFDPEARARSPEIAVDVLRRFARLQRQYGYWQLAWFENLLRCADAIASADKRSTYAHTCN